jgi:NAD-dependent dihydropyrimidine dehydrogenase PreA subunit
MGRFVRIAIDAGALDRVVREAVARDCPLDIYALDPAGALVSVPSREDECILCGRCVALAPEAVSVTRRYGACRPVGALGGSVA